MSLDFVLSWTCQAKMGPEWTACCNESHFENKSRWTIYRKWAGYNELMERTCWFFFVLFFFFMKNSWASPCKKEGWQQRSVFCFLLFFFLFFFLRNLPLPWLFAHRIVLTNSIDLDQTLCSAASDLGLHCLPIPSCPNFRENMVA